MPLCLRSWRRRLLRSLFLAGLLLGSALLQSANAQVAIVVNGDPITVYDIEQRAKLLQLSSGGKGVTRQQVIDELINDRLKLSDARRYKMEISDTEVNNAFSNIAKNTRSTPENFARSLQSAGVNPDTLKARLKADIAWAQIIRGKFQAALQVGEREIFTALESRKQDDIGYEYTLTPILFIAPRGSSDAILEARKRDAELLRARFVSCESGIPFARGLRDVVVRDPIRKNSADLSPQHREILNKLDVGRLSTPEVTPGGIEVVALCNKKETTADTPARRALREEMFAEKFQAQAQRYLKELRKSAMIENRMQ